MTAPKVFMSHATEDKSRFVVPFSARLRHAGVDVWLDTWEILPGDSLVQRIFDEALDNADAVIIVLSETSVNKPWVREELDASVVAKITKGIRLIPVVLDECDVPPPLRHLLWVKIPDLTMIDDVVERVVAALFGATSKPPLGSPPAYVASRPAAIPDRSPQDATVLKIFCDLALKDGDRFGIMTRDVIERGAELGLSRDQVLESATILSELYDLEPSRALAPVPVHYTVTTHGFIRCVSATMPNYDDISNAVVSAIVNSGKTTNQDIADHTGANLLLVEQILEVLKDKGFIHIEKCNERNWLVMNVSPRLRRVLGGA